MYDADAGVRRGAVGALGALVPAGDLEGAYRLLPALHDAAAAVRAAAAAAVAAAAGDLAARYEAQLSPAEVPHPTPL